MTKIICEEFIGQDNVCLILGDNVFYGYIGLDKIINNFSTGAHIFTYFVSDPQNFGVLEINRKMSKIKVKSINMIKKHLKPTKENKGGIISKENFIHLSNVRNLDTKKKQSKEISKK